MLGNRARFPVGEVVSGVFLKKITYEKTPDFEAAKFSFVRNDAWISLFVVNPPKIEDRELYEKQKYRAALKLESIASVFLDEETMRDCFRDADSFQGFVELLIAAIQKTNYKTVELDVKTLPGPKMGFTIPTVRKHGDKRRLLSYSDYEIKFSQNARQQQPNQ